MLFKIADLPPHREHRCTEEEENSGDKVREEFRCRENRKAEEDAEEAVEEESAAERGRWMLADTEELKHGEMVAQSLLPQFSYHPWLFLVIPSVDEGCRSWFVYAHHDRFTMTVVFCHPELFLVIPSSSLSSRA